MKRYLRNLAILTAVFAAAAGYSVAFLALGHWVAGTDTGGLVAVFAGALLIAAAFPTLFGDDR